MSDDNDSMDMSTEGLDHIMAVFKNNMPTLRVGILGSKAARNAKKGDNSNATIGASHEFGTSTLPMRSFLRQPLSDNLEAYLKASGAYDEKVIMDMIKHGTINEWMKKVGVTAESVVADAFSSGGFGKWMPSNMAHKENHQTLVETQQLRNSITSEVVE
jgi:hypothetical protein